MGEILTKQEKTFVNEVAKTGNKTLAVKKAFKIKNDDYAAVKGHRLIRKDKIVNAVEKALPEKLLLKKHKEGLEATQHISGTKFQDEMDVEDYSTRHKYLDTAYKLKGSYAPEKHLNLNIEAPISDRIKELALKLRETQL